MVTKSIALAAAMLAILVTGSPNVQGDQFLKSPALRPTNFTETAAAMEAAIQNLMLDKSGFGATPMGGSVKQIQNTLTKTMMPKVLDAHKADQRELNKLVAEIKKCGTLKNNAFKAAAPSLAKYKSQSRYHKRCRADEAVKFTSMKNCLAQEKSLHVIKKLKCNTFAATSKQLGTSKNNAVIVRKSGGESVLSYVTRLSLTFCGRHVHGTKGTKSMRGGWGGGLANGFLDKYLRAKDGCEVATKNYNNKVRECRRKTRDYNSKKGKCNQYQTLMDGASCKHAVIILKSCEAYAGCYYSKLKIYKILARDVAFQEVDRKAEWRGLKRMTCLIKAFADGKVTSAEVDTCKKESHSTALLNIKYPKIPKPVKCITPTLYPSTGAYKRKEFAPLPALAKGKKSVECSGVKAIGTKPRGGSPKTCKCNRVAIHGPYSAGAMVKCTKCLDARKSGAKNSCPLGTKIFSPASRKDWATFLSSAGPLRAPHWVIDVTRPQNGCGGCTRYPMNSGNHHQKTWRTLDKTPWWLRSTRYNEPNGDYNANCYLDLWRPPGNENSITFNDNRCNYHSKSYYCQARDHKISPRKGSPRSCKCTKIDLAASYSAGTLVKCEQCWTVYTSTQRNSCPAGMKIFSPRSRADWKTFLASAGPLRAPNWIVDVTRPQNGCGGCTRYPMKSSTAQQATWRTSDASPWWLRSSRYNEPNGDYNANCFLDLWKTPNSENNIQFNDGRCNYRSRSYYCQPAQTTTTTTTTTLSPRILVGWNQLKPGLLMKAFYFGQGSYIPNMNGRRPNLVQRYSTVNRGNTRGSWPGFRTSDNFAVRWNGILHVKKRGCINFLLNSDDGSRMYLDGHLVINNDGLHSWRQRGGRRCFARRGQYRLELQFFEKGGSAGMMFRWNYGGRWAVVPAWALKHKEDRGFKEMVYFIGGESRVPNFNRWGPVAIRTVPSVQYSNTGGSWPGFLGRRDNFGARWTGHLMLHRGGVYRFRTGSDDGSKVFINGIYTVNNDGLHGWRYANGAVRTAGKPHVRVEYFERGGNAGCYFYYQGPDTGNRMVVVQPNVMTADV